MKEWVDVTETFSEKQRHYKNVYLEVCHVCDEKVEVSLFSSVDDPYEIYVSYGKMYGIIYVEKEEAYAKWEEVKRVILAEYEKNVEPTSEFIKSFVEEYKLDLPLDIYFDMPLF